MTGRTFLVAAAFVAALSLAACGRAPKGELVKPADGVFVIDGRAIAPGEVRFYHYDKGGKSIVFFVARGPSGSIKTAFDACRSCYPRKLGYLAGDGTVTCRACGMVFKLDELDVGEGNCVPVMLKNRISGDKVIIDSRHVEQGADLF